MDATSDFFGISALIKKLPVAPSFKTMLLDDLNAVRGGASKEVRKEAWEIFCVNQRGTGIVENLKKSRDWWISLSIAVGFDHGLQIEDVVREERLIDRPHEFFLHMRTSFLVSNRLNADESLFIEVGLTYLVLESIQVAYKRDDDIMKRVWLRINEIAAKYSIGFDKKYSESCGFQLNMMFGHGEVKSK